MRYWKKKRHVMKSLGNNPAIRQQDDVDILALDKKRTKAIFCECKFRNRPMPMEEYDDLILASEAFPSAEKKYFIFISKSGFTNPVLKRAREDGAMLFTLEDLFACQ